jgi:uncharacterized membrane protein
VTFYFGQFLKLADVVCIFWLLVSTVKVVQFFAKKWIGLHLGRFFHKRTLVPMYVMAGRGKGIEAKKRERERNE